MSTKINLEMKRSFRLQQPAGFLGFDNSLLAIKYSFHSIL